jgi:hypothetical protein
MWLKHEQQEEFSFLWLGRQLRLRPYRRNGVMTLSANDTQSQLTFWETDTLLVVHEYLIAKPKCHFPCFNVITANY